MNLTDTYPGRPLRQVRTVALPVRKGNACEPERAQLGHR